MENICSVSEKIHTFAERIYSKFLPILTETAANILFIFRIYKNFINYFLYRNGKINAKA